MAPSPRRIPNPIFRKWTFYSGEGARGSGRPHRERNDEVVAVRIPARVLTAHVVAVTDAVRQPRDGCRMGQPAGLAERAQHRSVSHSRARSRNGTSHSRPLSDSRSPASYPHPATIPVARPIETAGSCRPQGWPRPRTIESLPSVHRKPKQRCQVGRWRKATR